MATRTVGKRAVSPETQAAWVNPAENPNQANADIKRVLAEVDDTAMPTIDFPVDDTVILPGGLIRDNELVKNVQVKELTGEDEEALARASQSLNAFVFMDRLLKQGVVQVGSEPVSEKDKILGQLLIGDREALILGIRRATYGDKIEVPEWQCSNCGVKDDLVMELSDIPVTTMSDPVNETSFKVPLRKGGFALVRLANGADQLAVYENPDLTTAQGQTVLLSRCVVSINDSKGEHLMAGLPSMARDMSVVDRHSILTQLRDRQPGPKYDKIEYVCSACNEKVFVVVSIGHLFLDFGWL